MDDKERATNLANELGFISQIDSAAEMMIPAFESVRADERERCAKIAEQVAINCERRAAGHTDHAAITSAKDKQFSAEEVAAKIRGTWVMV